MVQGSQEAMKSAWTQSLTTGPELAEVPRSQLAQLVTNTGARAKDVWPDVCSTGDVVSHSMLGEGGGGDGLQSVSTHPAPGFLPG